MVLHPGSEKKREALKRRMPTFPHPTHPNPIKPLKAILSKHHITPRNNTMHWAHYRHYIRFTPPNDDECSPHPPPAVWPIRIEYRCSRPITAKDFQRGANDGGKARKRGQWWSRGPRSSRYLRGKSVFVVIAAVKGGCRVMLLDSNTRSDCFVFWSP